jgi:cytoplasmic polyadenylation element-binding protein
VDASKPVDPRKAVFVGGVPRPLKASELAEVMTQKYGNVAVIMINSDSVLKYPKGENCVMKSRGDYIYSYII